ncbi:restriction endonuclease subunit S [Treponema berlinense]|uniref:restriction endonuclease subunit S n=1 Tax=Treponema berlinense TaxID=225004 RepID=UPI003F0C58D0
MTAKDLKNALLQEAVQGKLVPQIASEGNARDLLEEIRKEKLSHGLDFANAKSGKRKSKKETVLAGSNPCDIKEEEIPFDIPENWCWCRLGEIINIKSGDGLTSSQMKKGNIPVFGGNGITGYHNISNIHKESIVIGRVGFYCGSVHITPNEAWVTDNAFITTYSEKQIDKRFLVYVLRHLNLGQDNNATAQPVVSGKKIYPIPFPLPPLAEQKRIVVAIEKFMPLIEEYGKKETQLKAINEKIGTLTKKAILQEAVQGKLIPQIASEGNARDLLEEIKKEKAKLVKEGKIKKEKPLPEITEDEIPFDIPESWCWCRLSELCNLYTGDSINETEKKLKYTNVKEGWFYIGTKDVNFDQTINYDNGIKIPFEKDNFRIAPKNTVLMCIEGGSAGRKIAFTNQDVCFGNKLCCFNSYKNEIEKFIFYFLQSTLFTDAFKDNINGIIGGVSINNLKGMLFPLPPLAEQKRIVATIEKILPLCEKIGE